MTTKYKQGIYKITNINNSKVYFGSAKNLNRRLSEHKRKLLQNRHSNIHLQRDYNKHGLSSFTFEVIIYCEETDLLFYEQRFLDKYWDNSRTCYNIAKDAKAAMLGLRHSETTKAKFRLRKPAHSDETKKKIAATEKGKIVSEETRKKISTSGLGRKRKPFTKETKQKMALARTGKTHSDETKKKLSDIKTGKKLGPHTEITKQKISSSTKGLLKSDEAKQRMSDARKGKKLNKTTRKFE